MVRNAEILKELKIEREASRIVRKKGSKKKAASRYTSSFKQKVVDFHYSSGISMEEIDYQLDLSFPMLYDWKKTLGMQQTHIVHGNTTRADVRTKCLAIKDEIDRGMSVVAIANKYNITKQQYYGWKSKFKARYKEFLDLPDGVPYLAKTENLVFGDDNIKAFRELVNKQIAIREQLLASMHKLGYGHAEMEAETEKYKLVLTTIAELTA